MTWKPNRDITERLRIAATVVHGDDAHWVSDLFEESADEIERLRAVTDLTADAVLSMPPALIPDDQLKEDVRKLKEEVEKLRGARSWGDYTRS